jgi:preprotein translocase subunit SecG
MFPVLLASFWHYFFGITIFITSIFLILVVLVQRGRGGGLTGALGGMGGQSAFGAKAGDVFTRITMVTALIWIGLCMGAIKVLSSQNPLSKSKGGAPPVQTAPQTPGGESKPADGSEPAPPSETPAGPSGGEGGAPAPSGAAPSGSGASPAPGSSAPPAGSSDQTP